MNFCTKCGAKVETGTIFCTNCGQPLSAKPSPAQPTSSNTVPVQPIQGNINSQNTAAQSSNAVNSITNVVKNLSKTQKIIALSGIGVLVLLFILFRVGASLNSRDKVVTKFNEALTSKNATQLAKYIVSSDSKLKVDNKSIEALLSYIDKNPSYRSEITKSIQNQSDELEFSTKSTGKSTAVNAKKVLTNDLFTFKKKGKTWLFYDRYVFEINPVYVQVHTNYKDAKIYLGDTEVCTADKNEFTKEVGPYFPGLYTIKSVLKTDYVSLEKSLEVDLVKAYDSPNNDQRLKAVSINLDGYEVNIDSDYDDAKLLVNGKDTGLLIKDAQRFGPVSKDGSVKLAAQKQFPWGVVTGEEVPVKGSSYVYLKLTGINDDVKNSLMDTVNSYNKSYNELNKSRDASKLTNASEKKKKDAIEYVQRLITYKDMYTGSLTKAVFDLDGMRIYNKDSKYYAEVSDKETYNSAWYKEGSAAPQPTILEYSWSYTLVYDETSKQWLVDDAYKTYYFSPNNPKEFNF